MEFRKRKLELPEDTFDYFADDFQTTVDDDFHLAGCIPVDDFEYRIRKACESGRYDF